MYKDVSSFCLAIAVDPLVNTYKPMHCVALATLSSHLKADDAHQRLHGIFGYCLDGADAHPELSDEEAQVVMLLVEHRMLYAFLMAVSSSTDLLESMRRKVGDVLQYICVVVTDYHRLPADHDGTAAAYQRRWGDPSVGPDGLRRRFVADFPNVLDDPLVTGAFFPGLQMCRPAAFSPTEEPELCTCAKNYEDFHKHVSPGLVTVCCACAHPKVIGFIVLDKKEGPPALLNTILS